MSFRIALLPGDGVGPEVVDAALRRPPSGRAPFQRDIRDVALADWRRGDRGGAAGAAAVDAEGVSGERCGAARRGRRSAVRSSAARDARGDGAAGAAEGARRVCEPASRAGVAVARSGDSVQAGARQRNEHRHRARADGRAVFRRAARARAGSRLQHDALPHAGDRARRGGGVQAGAEPPQEAAVGRQAQRAGSVAAVAIGGDASGREVPRRDARASVCRRVRDEPRARPAPLRRGGHREHVRRHPVGRSGRDRRFARPAPLGEPRRRRRPLRAGPRPEIERVAHVAFKRRRAAARSCCRSTKRTCWKSRSCGARS